MPRSFTRRRWLLVSAGALAALLLIFGGLSLYASKRLSARFEEELSRRLAMPVAIEGVGLRLRGVVIEELEIGEASGPLRLRAEEVGVRVDPLEALSEGSRAVEYVQLRGGRLDVDLAHPDLPALLTRIRRRRAASGAGPAELSSAAEASVADDAPREPESAQGASREELAADRDAEARDDDLGTRTLEARDLDLRVRDRDGSLLEASSSVVRIGGGEVEVGAAAVELGGAEGDRAVLRGAFATLRRHPSGWKIASVVVDGAEVHWAAPILGDEAEEERQATDSMLVSRLRRAIATIRPPEEVEDEDEPASEDGGLPFLERLDTEARLDLGGIVLHGVDADGEALEVTLNELLVARRQGGALQLTGSGDGGDRGMASWNLVVDPIELTGHGELTVDLVPIALVAPLVPTLPLDPAGGGHLSADLRLEVESAAAIGVSGSVSIIDATLRSPRIADRSIAGITAELRGEGTWHPLDRRLEVDSGSLRLGEVEGNVTGDLSLSRERIAMDLDARLPLTECQSALDAIPRDALGPFAGFRMEGQIAVQLSVDLDTERPQQASLSIDVQDGCHFLDAPAAAELGRFTGPFTHVVEEPDGDEVRLYTGPGSGTWTPIQAVHPVLIAAVLSHEDASFYRHSGFAPWAIEEALRRNLEAGRFSYGASTITMQLAKNLFLPRKKVLVRKLREVLLTWWLERSLDKDRILELYLNVIEYGPGIYGIRNATRHYFGREPADVSPAEAAFLANILPNPPAHHFMFEEDRLSESMRNRIGFLLRHMASRDRISEEAMRYGLDEIEGFRFGGHAEPPLPARLLPGDPAYVPPERSEESDEAPPTEEEGAGHGDGLGVGRDPGGDERRRDREPGGRGASRAPPDPWTVPDPPTGPSEADPWRAE